MAEHSSEIPAPLAGAPRMLALDIGGGTQDALVWDPADTVENAVKLVVPAPTRIVARRIQAQSAAGRDIFLTGRLMGGGAVTQAVRRHLQAGLRVFAQPEPARTLHDSLDRLAAWGIIITDDQPPQTTAIILGDIDLPAWQEALARFGVPLPEVFAVAVQDHGFSPEASNRQHRFDHWQRFLAQGGDLRQLAYRQPPPDLTRMAAVQAALPGALVMDTCAAGVWGALLDPQVQERQEEGLVVVNMGNEHTFAVLIRQGIVWGIYEHHTGLLTPEKLADHLRRFQAGQLTHAEVFDDLGHGCCLRPEYLSLGQPFSTVVVTGPQRRLGARLSAIRAAPFGDMMLTGCFGLVAAAALLGLSP
jgi:uncharacterized protein (DUF1786 family)